MNIAHIITRSDSIGGAQVHVRDIAMAMQVKGHRVHVLVGGEGPFVEDFASRGLPVHVVHNLIRALNPVKDSVAFLDLRRAIRELAPDLVATHSSKAGWLGRLVAGTLGIPVVFTVHGWSFTEGVPKNKQRLYRTAERLAAPMANRIITVSEFDRELALRHRITTPEKLIAIHNGVPDISELYHATTDQQPPQIMMVARMDEPKDHETLLAALAGLKHTQWGLHLVGDGPLRSDYERRVDELGLSDKVAFWGSRKDIPELLATAQVFVLSSKWEGFPLTILEAMRAGLPVIASDVGGVKEAVVDGETGFLVPRQDAYTMRSRLETLIECPSLRQEFGKAGRERYERLFTLEKMVEDTMGVYEEALSSVRAS